jgi:general stress protein 26
MALTNPAELEAKFWKALKSDMTMMLRIARVDEAHTRPMTAQLDGDQGGPIWFFTAKVRNRSIATTQLLDHVIV